MNNILLEFARQARLVPEDAENGNTPLYEALELYAEAIIKECAQIADTNNHKFYGPGFYILKHFKLIQNESTGL